MFHRLRVLYDPARFQSHVRRDSWFEGWYFKLVDAEAHSAIAIIPGVSRDEAGGTSHSFVQIIRPGHPIRYERYGFDEFRSSGDGFDIRVGPNRFSSEGLALDISDDGTGAVRGQVGFSNAHPWPVTLLSPGIMGWYRYVPGMECYHGVVSMDHLLGGAIETGDERVCLDGGRGYAEKDWGTSFPSSWIWTQSNHFRDRSGTPRPGISLTCSAARIPWMSSSFTGHIAGVLLDSGELVRFATYTGSRITELATGDGWAHLVLADKRHRLEVAVTGVDTGALKAPRDGAMSGRADESLDAVVKITLEGLRGGRGRTMFEGGGYCAGAEIMNERGELMPAP